MDDTSKSSPVRQPKISGLGTLSSRGSEIQSPDDFPCGRFARIMPGMKVNPWSQSRFLRGLHPMSEEFNVQLEYRRRRARVYKSLILLVGLPFALTTLGFYVAGPAAFLSAGMVATTLGIAACVLFVLRIWRCPACGKSLSANCGGGTLGGKCIACQAQLYVPRRSKDGSRTYQ